MSSESGNDGGDTEPAAERWSDADLEAARAIERRCGIALVPDGIDD